MAQTRAAARVIEVLRSGLVLTLFAAQACATTSTPARVASPSEAPPVDDEMPLAVACGAPSGTEPAAEKAAADHYTAEAFTAALHALGLQTVVLHPTGIVIERSGEVEGVYPEGAILGPPYNRSTHRQEDGTPEFVVDGKNNLFVVRRVPRVELTKSYTLCGCRPGSGVAAQTVRNIYPVPSQYRHAGEVPVTYAARVVDVQLSGTNEQGQQCPQPP